MQHTEAEIECRIATLAEQVRRLSADSAAPAPAAATAALPNGSQAKHAIIASAEAAAAQIRAAAEREARRIRAGAPAGAQPLQPPLDEAIPLQRRMLAAVVLEADRIAHAAVRLAAGAHALDIELQATLDAARRATRRDG
jgi:hypothetical protein